MRVVVSAGGTGGHIYPALALINKIKDLEPNSEFLFIGTHNRMEKDIVPRHDINYYPLTVTGLKRKVTLENFRVMGQFMRAIRKAKSVIEDFDPDVVVGFGGYVTAPVIVAANQLKIPTLIHEQNSISGLANKWLGKVSTAVAVSFEETLKDYSKNAFFSGNPCSEEAIRKKPLKNPLFKKKRPLVVMSMGSLGSASVNKMIPELITIAASKNYNLVIGTGKGGFEQYKDLKTSDNVLIVDYIEDIVGLLKTADLFISRAGATTISEIGVIGVPTIFIPSPYVTANHQVLNAKSLVERDAALVLEEKDLTSNKLSELIDETLADETKLKKLRRNLKKTAVKNSATLIYEKLCEIKK